ncbi:small integral membrane protein 29-like [Anguilla anguilla]|uniref:small integral membrane protein 29-like n=1 Tax=Anguilla anguilla TaxID=7936 RepID=UPI0015AE6EB9|nr:small integral membrane protein 29-like [Anguilla anguilla]XP_035243257.1 small integral membrane protein 29-like [Anguilla anguilla]XP_035243258.1 small integral membrane protein 29-like [Anguilla anguilla]
MNTTSSSEEGDGIIHYVLLPIFFIAIVGVSAAGVLYMSKKRRIDRLRHQLVPVYTYDPLEEEEEEETERDVLLRSENAEAIQGWTGFYQHQHPLLVKNGSA